MIELVALLASSAAFFLYGRWLLEIFMQRPEQEYEACNRVMGTSFQSDAEYRGSRFGK